jgi:acetylglutamate kinase
LLDIEDENSRIPALNKAYYQQLKTREIITAGMIPKLDNAFAALQKGVRKVIIGPTELLSELAAGRSGTTITLDDD